MKFFKKCAIAVLAGVAMSALSVHAITLNFAANTNTDISFSGGGFTFTSDGAGYQFDITTVSGGAGDSVGLNGYISPGGPFNIGTVFTSTSIISNQFNVPIATNMSQFASVTGSGILNIVDTQGVHLTGNIQWDNIFTSQFTPGATSVGDLDLTGTVNLTGINYLGTNSDLTVLALSGSAVDTVSFQFTPPEDLSQLAAANGLATSYSGSITTSVVPEPGTFALAGIGFVGLLLQRLRRQQ